MNRRLTILAVFGMLWHVQCATTQLSLESGITNLTQLTSGRSVDVDPVWSRDGEKLAFASDRSGYLEIWAVPVRGGGIQQITSSSLSADVAPDFSPDGTEMLFQSTRVTGHWNIWKIFLGNRGLTQLTNNQFGTCCAKWSPDGTKIAYASKDKDGDSYIWVSGSGGESPTQLGPGTQPAWSPDGKRIAYAKATTKRNYDIWLMNSDGTNAEQLTSETEKQELSPAWSPDGSKLAYVVQYEPGGYFAVTKGEMRGKKTLRSEIWMIDLQGRNATQLTSFKGLNVAPAWSPDGRIAFVSSRGSSWNIWTMTPSRAK